MSTLLVSDMVSLLQQRIPVGLTNAYCIARLNEGFRWIAQQDSFMWALRRVPVTVNASSVDFPLPADAAPGDPMSLYGQAFKYEIPFVPFEKFSVQEVFNTPPILGNFSAFTITNNGTIYHAKLAPDTALSGPVTLNLFYHTIPFQTTSLSDSYPSPDEFDSLIVDLAEAEIKRVYHYTGWQDVQSKATEEVKKLANSYRSSKRSIEGMASEAMNAQEAQLKKAE
jgi:hypothetical protein